MCCCGKPNVNGTMGYKWQPNDTPMVRQVDPPALDEGDTLLFDEPGRCGGLDAHAHHFRLVKGDLGTFYLLVRNGGGDKRIRLCCVWNVAADHLSLADMSSDARYWLFNSMYNLHRDADSNARIVERDRWAHAFVEKRIKRRKRGGSVRVWIEDAPAKETTTA